VAGAGRAGAAPGAARYAYGGSRMGPVGEGMEPETAEKAPAEGADRAGKSSSEKYCRRAAGYVGWQRKGAKGDHEHPLKWPRGH
jgi:hypothetical protein